MFDSSIEKKLEELMIRNQQLDRHCAELLEELEVSPDQLTKFIAQKDNFTEKNWENLQKVKVTLEEKLAVELNNIRDPKKIKNAQNERNIGHHWMFVR